MKLFSKLALTALISTSLVSVAQANDGKFYVGAKAGKVTLGSEKTSQSIPAYGVYGGVNMQGGRTVEVEFVQGSEEKIKTDKGLVTAEFASIGIYGVYKAHLPQHTNLYGKLKLGTSIETSLYESVQINDFSSSEKEGVSFGYGAAVGYNVLPNVAVQAEYAFVTEPFANISAHVSF